MHDTETTLAELKQAVICLCKDKGWGEDGIQNPQHVAMAMNVEAAELLEQFQWLTEPQVQVLLAGEDPERTQRIGEEFADVMMYGLQLMYALGIDISSNIERKIDGVRRRPADYNKRKQEMRDAFERENRR